MKRDPLETFIQSNRSAFDQSLPEHNLWSKIEKQLPKDEGQPTLVVVHKRSNLGLNILKYAAAILVIVSLSVFGTMQYVNSTDDEGISASMINEINEIADYYDFEVKRKLKQLAAYEPITEVYAELTDIDQVISDLKVELNEVQKGSEEKVINAMIDNFQLKILILERMLDANTSHFNNSETKDYEINL